MGLTAAKLNFDIELMVSLIWTYQYTGFIIESLTTVELNISCGTKAPPRKQLPKATQLQMAGMEFFVAIFPMKKLRLKAVMVKIREFIICNSPLNDAISLGYIMKEIIINKSQINIARIMWPKNS